MKMRQAIKVLIADGDRNERHQLKEYLIEKGYGIVVETGNGNDALDIIESMKPHVVVTDIWLEGMNGIRLMKNAKERIRAQKPVFVFWTAMENEKLCNTIIQESNDSFILRPCDFKAVEKLINDAYCVSYTETRHAELKNAQSVLNLNGDFQSDSLALEAKITEVLQKMGMPANLKGYRYLRSAIMLTVCGSGEEYSVTKILYPMVASHFDTSPSRVERAIRHAIETVWHKGNSCVIGEYFVYKSGRCDLKPTNGEFIAVVSDTLRLEAKRTKLNELLMSY